MMTTTTMKSATTNSSSNKERERRIDAEARALRVVHREHAAEVVVHARAIQKHAKKLVKIQARIDAKARVIAGDDYKEYHDVGYDVYGPMASQRLVDDGGIIGTGFGDVVEMAQEVAVYAARIAADKDAMLPSE
jgi:hypothetical protein